MGNFSPVHWIIVLMIVGIQIPPIVRILNRTGHSGWWSILYLVPLINWVALWVFAYAKWPKTDTDRQAAAF